MHIAVKSLVENYCADIAQPLILAILATFFKEIFEKMKNLNKGISVALASSLVLSTGSFVANADFTDVDDSTSFNEEINVLAAIDVINGMEEGTFDPDGELTRAQAAKIIAYLKLGSENAELISAATTTRFTDVASDHWAAGYIEYCANLGIIEGVGDDMFLPEDKLSASAFTKMLLVTVGFDAEENGFTGLSWAINVAATAVSEGIYDSSITISNTNILNRAEASRLSYLGLFFSDESSTETTYTGYKLAEDGSFINPVSFSSFFEAYVYAGADGKITTETTTSYTDSLAENVFSLTKSIGADSFGRPAIVYDAANFTTPLSFTDEATFTLTAATSETTLTSLLKSYTFAQGAGATDVSTLATMTGNGNIVEIYTDGSEITNVVAITPEFVSVSLTEKDESKTEGAYTQYSLTLGETTKTGKLYSSIVDDETDTVIVSGSVSDGDMVLAYVDLDDTLYIEEVKIITGTLESITSTSIHTIDGVQYPLANSGTAGAVSSSVGSYYVDSFGNFLGTSEATVVTNHALILSQSAYSTLVDGAISTEYRTVIVKPDSSIVTVVSANEFTGTEVGTVMTYTINSSDVYTFSASTDAKAIVTLEPGVASLGNSSGLYANNATKFVTVDYKTNDDGEREATGTVTVYTGIANVPSFTDLTMAYALDISSPADTIADVVYIYDDISEVLTDSYVYLTGTYSSTVSGRVYDTLVEGVASTITIPTGSGVTVNGGESGDLSALTAGMYSEISVSGNTITATLAESEIKKVQNVGNLIFTANSTDGAVSFSGIQADDDVAVYSIDTEDNTVSISTVGAMTSAKTGTVHIVTNTAGDEALAIYILS